MVFEEQLPLFGIPLCLGFRGNAAGFNLGTAALCHQVNILPSTQSNFCCERSISSQRWCGPPLGTRRNISKV